MKKFLGKLSLLMCIAATSMAVETPLGLPYAKDIKHIVERGELRVAIYVDSALAPFVTTDGKELGGYNVELAKIIASQLGVKLHVDQTSSYNESVAFVAKGKDDIAVSNITATPERALSVAFTEPYYAMPQTLIVKKAFDGSKMALNETIVSTDPLRIAIEANSAYLYCVKQVFPNAVIVTYANMKDALANLKEDQYDAIFTDGFSGEGSIAKDDALALVRLGDKHVDPVSIVVSAKRPQLVNWLNLYLVSGIGKEVQANLQKSAGLI